MSLLKKLKQKIRRRTLRVRAAQNRGTRARVSVFRSINHIYAQIIDDNKQTTLVSYSSLNLEKLSGKKVDVAKMVGLELGKIALSKDISNVFFDRGCYLYHGRVKALAEGLREAGLKF